MTLIVETGTGGNSSESYCDLSFALNYHNIRGASQWATITTAQQEQALRRATDYMTQAYSMRWQGERSSQEQALDWPRVGVLSHGYPVLSSIVPHQVKNACAELALRAAAGEMIKDVGQSITRTKVSEIEVEYDKNSAKQTKFEAVDAILSPLFISKSSFDHKLVR